MMIKVFRVNTGSCGGCDAEIDAAVAASVDVEWAASPFAADVLLLTGPLTAGARPAFMSVWQEVSDRVPLVAIGRCAIDGHPFGRGGLAEAPQITVRLKIDGCAVESQTITNAIRDAVVKGRGKREEGRGNSR
jgi:Ni,Fe-hydrogenase III small subunit